MAIGYGVAVPKGRTRKQLKARKDREDAKQLKVFRDAVWLRESQLLMNKNPNWISINVAACQHCGHLVQRMPDLLTGEVHHRISRRHKATRYDPDNGVLLCNHLVNNCHEKAERGDIKV